MSSEQPRVLGFVAHAGDVGAERGAADRRARGERALGGGGDDRLQRGEYALAVGLAERDQPHAGGDPVGVDRVQKRRAPLERECRGPRKATPTATG